MLSVIRSRLTVCAQGGRQHLDALVSDGLSSGEVRGQRPPGRAEAGRHGAGRGGGGLGGLTFALSAGDEASQQAQVT